MREVMRLAIIVIITLVGLLWYSIAKAGPLICGPRDKIAKTLNQLHEEVPRFRAIAPGGKTLLEIYVSPKGTFSMLVVQPNKRACFALTGKDWIEAPPGTF